MRNAVLLILAISIAIGGTLLASAQRGGGEGFMGHGGHGRGPGGPGFGGPMFDRLAEQVGATDEQKAKIKTILDESRTRFESLMESVKGSHEEIENLGTDGVYNEKAVMEFAAKQAEVVRQTIIEKEKTKAAVFAVLTDEQRAKAVQLRADFEKNHKNGFPGMKGGPEGAKKSE